MERIEEFVKLNNFEELCKEKQISVKRDGDYMLLKYQPGADFTDPIVKQSRGIIFKDGKVVCRPFDKFCNYGEEGADEIDWASARVQEKIDGSLMKCFYDNGYWHWATNGIISAADSKYSDESFLDLLHEADNFGDIPFETLNTENTYLFELVSPKMRVVIKYPKTHIYHIGTRRISGEELSEDIGVEKPREFDIHTLRDCIKAAEALNQNGEVEDEGYVVVDKNYHRIKVKSPEYILLHGVINNHVFSLKRALKDIQLGNGDAYMEVPEVRIHYLRTKYLLAKLEYDLECDMQTARAYYEEFDFDRKRATEEIKKLRYPFAGFAALGNEMSAHELMERLNEKSRTVEKCIASMLAEEEKK